MDRVYERIPPEFTIKDLAVWLVLAGCVIDTAIEVWAPGLSIVLVLGIIATYHYVQRVKQVPNPVATVMYFSFWLGILIPELLTELWSRPLSEVGVILCQFLPIRAVMGMVVWHVQVKPALSVLPKGWDTPVRYYFDL